MSEQEKPKEEVKISYKGQRGGYRHNAGRKKGTSAIIMERSRQRALEMIEKEMVPLVKASLDLAKGIYIETPEGGVYQQKPDIQALKHLLDQLVGKPKESIDLNHTGEIGLADLLGKGALDNKKPS